VAVAAVALFVLVSGASGLWFAWQAQRFEDESIALYREIFPDERRVIRPRKQMAAHLQGSGLSGPSPLPLLATAAGGIEGSRVDELRFRRERNQLQLQLRVPSIEALDQIKQELAGSGLNVEINSAAEQGNETVGRLIIGGTR
jgi:general secretion pathway protein L